MKDKYGKEIVKGDYLYSSQIGGLMGTVFDRSGELGVYTGPTHRTSFIPLNDLTRWSNKIVVVGNLHE